MLKICCSNANIGVCHETVRFWWDRLKPMLAGDIGRQRVSAMRGFRHRRWQFDEVYVKSSGETHCVWRAVDHEGEVRESHATKTRDKAATLTFMKKTLKRHGSSKTITTDGLQSSSAAMNEPGNAAKQESGRWANNRVDNSPLAFHRREQAMLRFRQIKSFQKFALIHASVHNHFNLECRLVDRKTFKERRTAAHTDWRQIAAWAESTKDRSPSWRDWFAED